MFSLFSPSTPSTAQLNRMERKLDLILKHLGLELADAEPEGPWRTLADQGEKIAAIRAYREAAGVGLAEAKEAVDSYMRRR
jgi:ribosomal protein L7/L12